MWNFFCLQDSLRSNHEIEVTPPSIEGEPLPPFEKGIPFYIEFSNNERIGGKVFDVTKSIIRVILKDDTQWDLEILTKNPSNYILKIINKIE